MNPKISTSKAHAKTRMGVFLLESTASGLYALHFPKRYAAAGRGHSTIGFLRDYFRNPRASCSKLKLDLNGYTPFQRKVYAVLRKVPVGQVITYGELAKRAGYPKAARAVGTAMRKNRLPIVIPCHRVIKSNGGLGQYSGGIKRKRFLLRHEGYLNNPSIYTSGL